MNWLKDNWFRIIIAISFLIAALSVRYYFIDFLPMVEDQRRADALQALENERQAREEERREDERREASRQLDLSICFKNAFDTYDLNWETACSSRSLGEDCRLPQAVAKSLEDSKNKNRDICLKRYGE